MKLRLPANSDRLAISRALVRQCVSVREAPVVQLVDVEDTVNRIITGQVDSVVINEAYLLCYAVCTPWYSNKDVLEELLVLRIGSGGEFKDVVTALEYLATTHDVDMIHVGGSFSGNPQALGRLYSRHGYAVENTISLVRRRK